jgi:hypothetical protein
MPVPPRFVITGSSVPWHRFHRSQRRLSFFAVTLCEKGAYVTHVPLSGGVQSYVVVTNPSACAITLPKARGSIVCRVELPRFVFAPIESGYTLGRLVFYCDTDLDGKQEYLDSVNLVTRYEVDRTPPPTIWTRILHFFKQFFN